MTKFWFLKIADELPDFNSPTDDWLQLQNFFYDVADDYKEIGWQELMMLLNNSRREGKLEFLNYSMNFKPHYSILAPIKEATENDNNQTILEDYEKQQIYPKRNCFQVIWDFLTCNNKMHDTTINAPLINGNNKNNEKTAMKIVESKVNLVVEQKQPPEFSEEVCRSMIKMLDFNNSGKLGIEEFKKLIFEIAKWKVNWSFIDYFCLTLIFQNSQAVFKLYDKDKNNKLDTLEFRDAMESAGYLINNKILISLLHRYGSADKTMTMDVFIMCAVKLKTIIEQFREINGSIGGQTTFSVDDWVSKVAVS